MTPVSVTRGDAPVLLAMPHCGTWLPAEVASALSPRGQVLSDADWHIDRLYDGLLPGATVVRANFHRYVVDANRPPDGASLYPGQNTTGLVPLTDFDGQPIWAQPPGAAQIVDRCAAWHAPYHQALRAELARLHALHGAVILFDCHSIRSRIPYLFEGRLPDFNIGTAGGTSCDARVQELVQGICAGAPGYSHVLNGRFKGGWTTRHYGQPDRGVHAIQMELAQATHLASESPPYAYDPGRAARLRLVLRDMLRALAALVPDIAPDLGQNPKGTP